MQQNLKGWLTRMHTSGKRTQVGLGVLCVALAGTLAYSCGASTSSPPNTADLISPAYPSYYPPGVMTAVHEPSALLPAAPVQLTDFTPLLALPELTLVGEAVDAGDAVLAYQHYLAALQGPLAEAAGEAPYHFQRGVLASEAQLHAEAAAAFAACAAQAWELSEYCTYFAARAEVRAGASKAALNRLTAGKPSVELLQDWWDTLLGEAALAASEIPVAAASLKRALERAPKANDRHRRAMLYAEAVVQGAPPALARAPGPNVIPSAGAGQHPLLNESDVLAALRWVRRAVLETAGSPQAVQASAYETKLLALLSPDAFRANQGLTPEDHLVRLSALVDRRRFTDARVAADELINATPSSAAYSPTLCEVHVLRGKALAGLSQWGMATDLLAEVANKCIDPDLRARAMYLAGRYARYDKRWSQSARILKQLEQEVPEHRLADDARLMRAEAHLELSDDAEYTRLLSTFAEDYPNGDMVLDGVSALALRLMTKGQWGPAANVLERGTALAKQADRVRDHEYAGRERYLMARAWIQLGEEERGLSEFEALVRERPLSYYMQHAYSRLHEVDPARAARAREEAMTRTLSEPFRLAGRPAFETPAFRRVLELLRQGQLDWASLELDALAPGGASPAPEVLWATALLFARAGSAKLSHQLARGKLSDWLNQWPAGEWRQAWELAFPRPYKELAEKEAERNGISPSLVYAVMREESGFDPRARSHADAFGLMQLIEPTARHFAKDLRLSVSTQALFTPRINIALGARTLSNYCGRFPDNPLLGIPSYNAGPGRPKRWLKELPSQEFDLWVELIPYRETRRYTKRVLASYGVYRFLYEEHDQPWLLPRRVQ